jgi:hypothetical protein
VKNATFAPRQRDRLGHVQVRHGVANLSRRRRPVEHHIVWQRGRSPAHPGRAAPFQSLGGSGCPAPAAPFDPAFADAPAAPSVPNKLVSPTPHDTTKVNKRCHNNTWEQGPGVVQTESLTHNTADDPARRRRSLPARSVWSARSWDRRREGCRKDLTLLAENHSFCQQSLSYWRPNSMQRFCRNIQYHQVSYMLINGSVPFTRYAT